MLTENILKVNMLSWQEPVLSSFKMKKKKTYILILVVELTSTCSTEKFLPHLSLETQLCLPRLLLDFVL